MIKKSYWIALKTVYKIRLICKIRVWIKHYSVLACCLRCRGLRDSFAVKATLKISDWHWHWHYWLVLDILCVIYFLTSITMPDPQTSEIRQIVGGILLPVTPGFDWFHSDDVGWTVGNYINFFCFVCRRSWLAFSLQDKVLSYLLLSAAN